MPKKPTTRDGYTSEQLMLVRQTCLYVATKVGDLLDDVVIVGGLVPSLLIDPKSLPDGEDPHVGTTELDLGLTVALLSDERYTALAERFRRAGFAPDRNSNGNPTRQRWKVSTELGQVTVDFLIPPSREGDKGGAIRHIDSDFAAYIIPGLELAFADRESVTLSGETILGEKATRQVWVCGPAAFVVLKALAFGSRGENKDAYDLYYVLRNYGGGVEAVAERTRQHLAHPQAEKALAILRADYTDPDSLGPMRAAEFLTGGADEDIQADVVGYVEALLRQLD